MKVAIIGSRTVKFPKVVLKKMLEELPENCTEIVSGGTDGVDRLAEQFAKNHGLRLTVISQSDPLKKSRMIADYADSLIAFWDCTSRGTAGIISSCTAKSKYVKIIAINKQ